MRAWWSRLTGSPRSLAAVGAGLVVLVATATTLVVVTGGEDAARPATASNPSPESSSDGKGADDDPSTKASKGPNDTRPPDKDVYCPAFRQIRGGGLTTPGDDEQDGVDLAELSRTFDSLLTRYGRAERVSPLSLRDDYAQALGYLEQGKKATASNDVELLKALVVNLDSLNDSMDAIQAKSAQFCG